MRPRSRGSPASASRSRAPRWPASCETPCCPPRSPTPAATDVPGALPVRAVSRARPRRAQPAHACGAPGPLGRALRTLGLVRGDLDLLRESLGILDGTPWRLEHAQTLVELGAALRRGGRRSEAREPLHAGMELAHACGARPLVARAREELLATGAATEARGTNRRGRVDGERGESGQDGGGGDDGIARPRRRCSSPRAPSMST
jgi:hypothetical protein